MRYNKEMTCIIRITNQSLELLLQHERNVYWDVKNKFRNICMRRLRSLKCLQKLSFIISFFQSSTRLTRENFPFQLEAIEYSNGSLDRSSV